MTRATCPVPRWASIARRTGRVVCTPSPGRMRLSSPGPGPVGVHVAAPLAGDARTETHDCRVRRDLARDERLSQAEVRGEPDQARRREPEELGDEGAVGGRVEPHEDEVVAL